MRYRKNAMIVAAQPESTEAAAEILQAGGNAVDAALACALVQGVVDPLMCGIAGFGSCGIAMPGKGFHGYIDFHAPAPRAVHPDMWADLIESEARDGYGVIRCGRVSDIGYQSICAPASLRAYRDAHREHGRLPWEQVRPERPFLVAYSGTAGPGRTSRRRRPDCALRARGRRRALGVRRAVAIPRRALAVLARPR
jgi:gamma-glutamyltranspeptidase/glutathione hydrolase